LRRGTSGGEGGVCPHCSDQAPRFFSSRRRYRSFAAAFFSSGVRRGSGRRAVPSMRRPAAFRLSRVALTRSAEAAASSSGVRTGFLPGGVRLISPSGGGGAEPRGRRRGTWRRRSGQPRRSGAGGGGRSLGLLQFDNKQTVDAHHRPSGGLPTRRAPEAARVTRASSLSRTRAVPIQGGGAGRRCY